MINATGRYTITIPGQPKYQNGIYDGIERIAGAKVLVELDVSPAAGAEGVAKAKEFYALCEAWMLKNVQTVQRP